MSRLDPLHQLAERVSRPPHDRLFVGGALLAFRTARGQSEADLAAFLGCPVAALVKLALCRRPELAAARFEADVSKIADYAGVNRDRLAEVLSVASHARQ